jgi:predicted GIY-YIG superfamily endonuclease
MKVYALKLQQGKYYVGRTNNTVAQRIEEHQSGACAWTRKYPPLENCLIEEISTSDRNRENSVTFDFMKRYGIENVRGGVYSKMTLSAGEINTIEKNIRNNHNECLRCGRRGHFAKDCYATRNADGSEITDKSTHKRGTEADSSEDDDDSEDGDNNPQHNIYIIDDSENDDCDESDEGDDDNVEESNDEEVDDCKNETDNNYRSDEEDDDGDDESDGGDSDSEY